MARQETLIQVKFRIKPDVLRKLEREAKRHTRSVNDEIGRRLEESLVYGRDKWREDLDKWREERLILLTMLQSHPALTPQEKAAVARVEEADQKDAQDIDFEDIKTTTEGDPS
jgi:hypothetical protein